MSFYQRASISLPESTIAMNLRVQIDQQKTLATKTSRGDQGDHKNQKKCIMCCPYPCRSCQCCLCCSYRFSSESPESSFKNRFQTKGTLGVTDLKKHATSPTHLNLRNLVSFHIISEFSRTRQMPLYLYIYVYNPYITNHRELHIYQSDLRNIMKHPNIHHSLSFFIYPNLSIYAISDPSFRRSIGD